MISDSNKDSEILQESEPAETDSDKAAEAREASLVSVDDSLPTELTVLPLSNRPLFPGLVVPLVYEGAEMAQLVRDLAENHEQYVEN